MDDLLGDFLAETSESLDYVDVQLVKFEQDPNNDEILDNIFRLVHTIKGTCGFLGLPRLESVAHAAENLMGRFREGAPVTEEAVSVILASIDRIKEIMTDLEANQAEPEGSDEDLIRDLSRLAGMDGPDAAAPAPAAAEAPEAQAAVAPAAPAEDAAGQDDASGGGEVSLDELDAAFAAADVEPVNAEAAQTGDAEAAAEAAPAEAAPAAENASQTEAAPVTEAAAASAAAPAESDQTQAAAPRGELDMRAKSIRVNVDTLEKLMTTVSELVLARNQLLEIGRHIEDGVLQAPLQRLSSVTAELQERVMKTRMQPIGNAWQKLPRIIRTLAQELNKKINLEMTGEDTELDRQVLELIRDPLTHMIRNSADHGLEDTETRLAQGKPPVGQVLLDARHEGGHIVIEISDDGRGLNIEKIRKKAQDCGLASATELEAMSDQQIAKLIFEPGLSTAEAVTNVSGRGVGMDVVRSNIELIGGSIDVHTVQGEGSKFTIQIPLTLAIVPALIIGAGGQRFALPQLNIIELVRVRAGDEHAIEMVNDSPILRLRGRLLPLVRLSSFFEDERWSIAQEGPVGPEPDADEGEPRDEAKADDAEQETQQTRQAQDEKDDRDSEFVAVLRIGGFEFGMVADAVFDTEEIVVKPLSSFLKNVKAFSGNTILGDGSVVMIIDPTGAAEVSGMRAAAQSLNAAHADDSAAFASTDEAVSLLIFMAGSEDPRALPLALINRLEEIDMADVERAAGREVVQYRDALMSLIRLDDGANSGVKPVIVIESGGHHTGLVVDRIVDVVEERLSIEPDSGGVGALGSAVVAGNVTEILDLAHYLPEMLTEEGSQVRRRGGGRVLLVDDSAFFRNMLSPFLSAHGLHVTAVASAAEALDLGRRGRKFDFVVSDIEMPDKNGFEFAAMIKDSSLWDEAVLIALSANTADETVQKSIDSGFSEHVAKFDRIRLLELLTKTYEPVEVAA